MSIRKWVALLLTAVLCLSALSALAAVADITLGATGGENKITVSGTAEPGETVRLTIEGTAFTQDVAGGPFSHVFSPVPAGTYTVVATYVGDALPGPASVSNVSVTNPPPPPPPNIVIGYAAGGVGELTVTGSAQDGQALTVTLTVGGSPVKTDTAYASEGTFAYQAYGLDPGSYTISVTYTPDVPGTGATQAGIQVQAPTPPAVDLTIADVTLINRNQVKVTGTGNPNQSIVASVGAYSANATVQADGGYSTTILGLADGTYGQVEVKYQPPKLATSGNDATWSAFPLTVAPLPPDNNLYAFNLVPGYGSVYMSGKGKVGSKVSCSIGAPFTKEVTIDSNGNFEATFDNVPAGVRSTATVQYSDGTVGTGINYTTPYTVLPPITTPTPTLTVDPLYSDSRYVMGKTQADLNVRVQTKFGSTDFDSTTKADTNGLFTVQLPSPQLAGAKVKVTVTYEVTKTVSVELTVLAASSSVYTNLRKGSTGTAVTNLQARLLDLGYPVTVTGTFDNQTEAAVRSFQYLNGLGIDGIAGRLTQTALYSVGAVPYSAGGSGTYVTLVRGDRGERVRQLQQRLAELGYYTIRVDGIFGVGTQTAVRNFQSNNALPVTGVADAATQALLFSSAAKPSYTAPSGYVTLRNGSRGTAVRNLQTRLSVLGYYYGSLDGIFGSQTEAAVRSFQRLNGLGVNGVADVTTQNLLFSSSAIPYSSSPSTGYVYLHYGSEGQAVVRLQTALRNKGYYMGKLDGKYYDQTYDAVKRFQRDNGLVVDGLAGKMTQNKLYGTSY